MKFKIGDPVIRNDMECSSPMGTIVKIVDYNYVIEWKNNKQFGYEIKYIDRFFDLDKNIAFNKNMKELLK